MCRLPRSARRSPPGLSGYRSHHPAKKGRADSLRRNTRPRTPSGVTMPPAIAIAIASLAATAGGAAYEGYENAQAPGQQAQAASQAALSQQAIEAQQAGSQKQQAINAQVANADQQTGGSLSSGGLANLSSLLAGYGGQAGGAQPLQQVASGASATSSPGLQEALAQLT